MRRAAILAVLPPRGALERAAHACGCFVPPDPSVPIVQAGERILFVRDGGRVTAHIQIQYAGRAADFGWLLPLPSVPTLKVGGEELFTALINGTQPKYVLTRVYDGDCFSRGGGIFGGGGDDLSDSGGDVRRDAGVGPLVVKDSIGPYDYAVLRADDKAEMFAWLAGQHAGDPQGARVGLQRRSRRRRGRRGRRAAPRRDARISEVARPPSSKSHRARRGLERKALISLSGAHGMRLAASGRGRVHR